MHARSKTFELDPAKLDAATEEFKKKHLHRFQAQKGFKRVTIMGNRKSGNVTAVSFWESESDMQASNELGREAGEDMNRVGGGRGAVGGGDGEVLVDA
ncbi:MAG: hypothetical protein QOJ01_605 [Solirubrobacterales bacterium]|jgi:heme-degrading monooxygenase HmoA|nr:hypothetical protein [Solirubrobacterales bacterium]